MLLLPRIATRPQAVRASRRSPERELFSREAVRQCPPQPAFLFGIPATAVDGCGTALRGRPPTNSSDSLSAPRSPLSSQNFGRVWPETAKGREYTTAMWSFLAPFAAFPRCPTAWISLPFTANDRPVLAAIAGPRLAGRWLVALEERCLSHVSTAFPLPFVTKTLPFACASAAFPLPFVT